MKWKIYYEDGSTFSDEDGTIEEAPARGVICIVQADGSLGRRFELDEDFYVWSEAVGWKQGWTAMNIFGLMDFLIELGLVKFGRMTDDQNYQAIKRRAAEDPGFPRKSNQTRKERRHDRGRDHLP